MKGNQISLPTSSEEEIAEFLSFYPAGIARQAQVLRRLIAQASPAAAERIRHGWKLIGYDLPTTRKGTYFAWIWPEVEHIHVGWQAGSLMDDPDHVLRGAHLQLKKVRYLTIGPTDQIERRLVIGLTRQAERISSMSRAERQLLAMAREATAA